MNRINSLFERKKSDVLNIYFTAGFPKLIDTTAILEALQTAGVDIVEIGMPYSDPIADGPTIQDSNQVALENGMSLKVLFEQLQVIRETVSLPIVLMGYINPVIQFGIENFCQKCQEVGIDGLILPDLPMEEYVEDYAAMFKKYGLLNTFLITPQTSEERIRKIDDNSDGFIYMVSSASITGSTSGVTDEMEAYFNRINAMKLKNPTLIGFGIKDNATFSKACEYANGAIIGSQFVREVGKEGDLTANIKAYVESVRG